MILDLKTSTYKPLGIAIGLYLVSVIILGFVNYKIEEKKLNGIVNQQLVMAARNVPLILPKNFHHHAMKEKDLTVQQHLENIEKLSQFTALTNISYIYSLIKQGNNIVFTSSSATKEELISGEGLSLFFSVYDDIDPRVYDVFKTEENIFLEYTDSWGTFRSVFLLQTAEDGTRYVLAADMPISHIEMLLKNNLYKTLLISLLFFLLIFPVFLIQTKKLALRANALKDQVI